MTSSIPDIPAGLTGDQLIQTLNDRIRRIVKLLATAGGVTADLDMAGFRIIKAGDAVDPKDLVNLETGDARYLQQPVTPTTPGSVHTIIMQSTGNIAVGNLVTPAYTTTRDPAFQYVVEKAYIAAVIPPTGSSAIVDPVVLPAGSPAGTAYQKILTSPLVLPAGSSGPVTVENFVTIPFTTTELDLFNANVLQVGSSFPGAQVFIGLRVRQTN